MVRAEHDVPPVPESEQPSEHAAASAWSWRPMTAADVAEAHLLGNDIHLSYPERPEIFDERFALFPQGCLTAVGEQGELGGYAVMHPAILYRPPALDSLLGELPAAADCLYLHDVALLSHARGHGLARAVVDMAASIARRHGLPKLALTAVNGSVPTWERVGFRWVEPDEILRAKLASYDADAAYLVRHLA